MLEEKKFESWSDFQEEIQNLVREQRQGILEEMVGSAYFFRGQSNAAWPLETSLERLLGPDQSMLDYYALIHGIQPEIETFTNKHWDLPGFEEYTDSLSSPSRFTSADQVSEYMLYLRHHGFPSPLLDWSYSPYVAAFFAFRDIGSNTESVAIFAYTIPNPGDLPPPNEPRIAVHWGREVRTNKRHYLQQSVYTTCKVPDGKNSYYTSHENLYLQADERRDEYLTKYILPASERARAILDLEVYNINAYSLFGTEESLLETMFARRHMMEKLREEVASSHKIKK